jgi:hypothetical protein
VYILPPAKRQNDHLPIQELISASVLDHDGDVVGVVQICRKGTDLSCGPDFSLEELRRLELAAKVLGDAAFMQPLNKCPGGTFSNATIHAYEFDLLWRGPKLAFPPI